MKPKQVKKLLLSEIKSVAGRFNEFCVKSDRHFTRNRKLPFETVIKTVFDGFTSKIAKNVSTDFRILAVDGSDIQIATNPKDLSSYHPGVNGQKPYNLLHLNALYDLKNHIYTDAVIQGRIKDGISGIKNGLELPDSDEFDIDISLKLSRKQTKEMKELYIKEKNHYKFIPHTTPFDYLDTKLRKYEPLQFYELHFRIVRFKISDDSYETILTNLSSAEYRPDKLKALYAARWGIETSFRDLKYTIGLLDFHSKKVMCIQQEIYAHLIMYNFSEMITSHVVIEKKQRKYTYKANFSVAAHMCRLFYQGKTTSPNLETMIARNIIPIRTDRHRERKLTVKVFHGFLYRVA